MKIPAEQIAKVFFAEVFQHRNILVIFFIIIALGIVGVGLVWPKKYTSSTTILVDERNIIRPLMEGAAVPTGVTDSLMLIVA